MLNIVNGYVCNNCTDVANAKKGVDPAHPKDSDALQQQPNTQNGIKAAEKTSDGPALILSGTFASRTGSNDSGAGISADNTAQVQLTPDPLKTSSTLDLSV